MWSSIRPFDTPLAPYILIWSLSIIMILVPPAGDIFNFIDDLQSYPGNIFAFATTFGLLFEKDELKMGYSQPNFEHGIRLLYSHSFQTSSSWPCHGILHQVAT
jgi:hypothetical protein